MTLRGFEVTNPHNAVSSDSMDKYNYVVKNLIMKKNRIFNALFSRNQNYYYTISNLLYMLQLLLLNVCDRP